MKKFGGFIVGFVVAVVSMVVGLFIFVGKTIHRGNKTMSWTTKRYIKDQFRFVDISKVKSAVANSIKAFIDWAFFAKETPCFKHRGSYYGNENESKWDMFDRSYHAQKHNDICEAINKCTAKTKTVEPVPYFIDEDEYGCGYYTMELMYDTSTDKLYDNYDDEEVASRLEFIKDMIKAEDPCLIEPGNYVYIHDTRDGTDYSIAIEDLSRDEEEEKSKEE